MALIDDLTINLANQWIDIDPASSTTFYTTIDLYSLTQDLFDELGGSILAGSMAYPTPLSAQTPTDKTLKDGWYITQASYKHLKGGSIQSSGFDSEIYLLNFASGGYTNAVAGDLYKVVTNGTATGVLLDYDNTQRKWWIRLVSGTFANGNSITITSGTGAGTLLSSSGVLTGEDLFANAYTVGTLNHGNTYFSLNGVVFDGTDWYGASNSSGNHIDILIKVRESGVLIDSGNVVFYNRNNRDAANALDGALTGDSYDWFEANLASAGRTPIPLTTEADLDDNLTNAQALDYIDASLASIDFTTGIFNGDINQDGSNESYTGQIDQDDQSNTILWSVIKYYFRKGSTELVNGIEAQQFRYLNPAYAVVKKSPVASIAGGKIFYARGWYPINVNSSDASNYQTIGTGSSTPIDPPVFFVRARSGVPLGSKVIIARRSALNFVDTAEFTLASGNNSGNSTLVFSGAIPSDKPSSGFVRVFDNSGNEDRYEYVSFTGSTLTLSGTLSKTYNTGNNAYIPYIDTTASSSTVSVALRYVSDRDVVSFVRLGSGASKITGDTTNYTLTSADSSIPVVAITDSINNN